jgi:hypothetical protein
VAFVFVTDERANDDDVVASGNMRPPIVPTKGMKRIGLGS